MGTFEIIVLVGIAAVTVILLVLIILILSVLKRPAKDDTEKSLAGVQSQLTLLSNTLETRISSLDQNLVNNLHRTRSSIEEFREKIGEVRESSKRIEEISRDISSLQDLLKPPQARGVVGETLLGNILAGMLPPEFYKLQYAIDPKSPSRVDAVVRIGDKSVPIDAKFPVEDYERIVAAEDDSARERARSQLIKNVKTKADDIAAKYIRPDLGTYDFALMYIPAEAVYYETMVLGDTFNYAAGKSVIPVSPGTFYLYLYTIILGLRGLRVEKEAERIRNSLSQVNSRLEVFYGDYEVLGKHLANAKGKYDECDRKLNTFRDTLDNLDGLAGKENDPLPPGVNVGD